MRRPLAVDAEVARRVDQPGAEVLLPDAIDDHAHRDRLRGDRARELEPAAALRERHALAGAQHRQEAARHRHRRGASGCRAGAPSDRPASRRRARRARRRTSAAAPSPSPRCPCADPRSARGDRRPSRCSRPQPVKCSSPGRGGLPGASSGSRFARKTSLQSAVRSVVMLRSSRPQPGQKSSLVLNSFGRLAGSFGLLVGSARALMMSFSFLISRCSSTTSISSSWNSSASVVRFLRRAAAARPSPASLSGTDRTPAASARNTSQRSNSS